jgi:hypothetical protein
MEMKDHISTGVKSPNWSDRVCKPMIGQAALRSSMNGKVRRSGPQIYKIDMNPHSESPNQGETMARLPLDLD